MPGIGLSAGDSSFLFKQVGADFWHDQWPSYGRMLVENLSFVHVSWEEERGVLCCLLVAYDVLNEEKNLLFFFEVLVVQ